MKFILYLALITSVINWKQHVSEAYKKSYVVETGRVCIVTAYRSVRSQTDSTPYHTSIGWRTSPAICAVSRDLLYSGWVHYGDCLYIEGVGYRIVGDVMNKRHSNRVDVWVPDLKSEKALTEAERKVYNVKVLAGTTIDLGGPL